MRLTPHLACGRGEIRTRDGITATPLFESGAVDHLATLPYLPSALEKIRTSDLNVRNVALYPAELREPIDLIIYYIVVIRFISLITE